MFSACTLIWDVSNDTIAGGDYTGVLNLAILTMALSVVPLSMVWVLPDRLDMYINLFFSIVLIYYMSLCI